MEQQTDYSKIQQITVPAYFIPSYRSGSAIQRGVEKNLMFKTWGGIGDQICAEPTLRYAFKKFKDCNISLASEHPELFRHLPWKNVYDLKKHQPFWEKYFVFETITAPDSDLTWQFFSHCLVNCVDFPSLCALRSQLPTSDKHIILYPKMPTDESLLKLSARTDLVYVHAGRHWPSKTFPKDWWDDVLKGLVEKKLTPVLIGADADDNRGTVNVDPTLCEDLRNKTSINDSIWLLQRAQVLLTNDSAPLHMAASGDAWIGFVATCKHPDYISHWRNNIWQWREENLGLGGMWDLADYCPNSKQEITVDKIDEATLRTWLPEPSKVVQWTMDKLK